MAEPDATPDQKPRVEPKLSMTADYEAWVDRHKNDAAAARSAATKAERERDEAKAAAERTAAEMATKLAETEARANERLIRADLKRAAKAAGLLDARDLATVDVAKLKLTEDGDVEGLDAFVDALKAERPHLFGKPSTSSTAGTPGATAAGGKRAIEMTEEEYRAARAAVTSRR